MNDNKYEVLLGVCGGIAAYKSATLVSLLRKADVGVTVVMTDAACELVAPKTFAALSGRPVARSMWGERLVHPHIELARQASLFCIAPATANIIAKSAQGLADDLMSATILAFQGKLLFAPAMNSVMWQKPATQRNVELLRCDGAIIVGPQSGRLSCGESGPGRMVEPEELFQVVLKELKE